MITASLAGSAVILAYLLNKLAERRRTAARHRTTVDEIHEIYFQNLDRQLFDRIWRDIASALEVDPQLLSPNDSIASLEPKHIPELYIDKVENFLKRHGVTSLEQGLYTSVQDLVNLIADELKRSHSSSE